MTEPLAPEEEREVRASMLPASHTYLWVLVRRLLATLDAARSTSEVCQGHCGTLTWTVEQYGYPTHKHLCPRRTRCQTHPDGCPEYAARSTSEGLDVERLARALQAGEVGCIGFGGFHGGNSADVAHRRDAEAVAREYAALHSEDEG